MNPRIWCLIGAVLASGCDNSKRPSGETSPARTNAAGAGVSSGPSTGPVGKGAAKAPEATSDAETRLRRLAEERARQYGVPLRTDEELTLLMTQTCKDARADGKGIILDFGADWCGDCRRLHARMRHPEIKKALEEWHLVQLNLGEDRHEGLRRDFGVRAIPRWFLLAPTDCTAPLSAWPRLADQLLERTPTPEALVSWLTQYR